MALESAWSAPPDAGKHIIEMPVVSTYSSALLHQYLVTEYTRVNWTAPLLGGWNDKALLTTPGWSKTKSQIPKIILSYPKTVQIRRRLISNLNFQINYTGCNSNVILPSNQHNAADTKAFGWVNNRPSASWNRVDKYIAPYHLFISSLKIQQHQRSNIKNQNLKS